MTAKRRRNDKTSSLKATSSPSGRQHSAGKRRKTSRSPLFSNRPIPRLDSTHEQLLTLKPLDARFIMGKLLTIRLGANPRRRKSFRMLHVDSSRMSSTQ